MTWRRPDSNVSPSTQLIYTAYVYQAHCLCFETFTIIASIAAADAAAKSRAEENIQNKV